MIERDDPKYKPVDQIDGMKFEAYAKEFIEKFKAAETALKGQPNMKEQDKKGDPILKESQQKAYEEFMTEVQKLIQFGTAGMLN